MEAARAEQAAAAAVGTLRRGHFRTENKMKKTILNLVAALTISGAIAVTATSADAQRRVVRTTHTTVVHRTVHHRARAPHRTCKTVWRHHKRVRTCRTW
jgi:hypothetical protein